MKKDTLFTPNPKKHLYTITIDVFENCSITTVKNIGDYKSTFHEVVGALESQKNHVMNTQREQNMKTLNKKNEG